MKTFSFLAATAVFALAACNRHGPSDRLDDNQLASTSNASLKVAANTPAKRCASGRTYDLIKHELFRRAAQLRGKDDAMFDHIAAGAALRVERPVVKSQDEGLGSIACSASVAVDLPPGLTVAGGRASLSADLDYTLEPAADASGDVVTLINADAITVPLATLGRSAAPNSSFAAPQAPIVPSPSTPMRPVERPVPPPAMISPGMRPPVVRPASPPPSASALPTPVPVSRGNPSFSCTRARTSGEILICGDPGLALLDRRMSAQYREAYAAASPDQRDTLRSTAHRFYGFRDNCPDARCIANGYHGRMREIDDIMRADELAPR